MTLKQNLAKLKIFLALDTTVQAFAKLRELGCDIQNVDECSDSPIYINLPLEGTEYKPFIGIFEAEAMEDGEVAMWVGIDDNNVVDGVEWQSSSEDMAKYIANKLSADVTEKLSVFCKLAFEVKQIIDGFN